MALTQFRCGSTLDKPISHPSQCAFSHFNPIKTPAAAPVRLVAQPTPMFTPALIAPCAELDPNHSYQASDHRCNKARIFSVPGLGLCMYHG